MSHTIRDQKKLLARVRRIRGQVEGIERALESKAGCEQVMHLIAGCRGAINGLLAEVIEDHIREHMVDPAAARDDPRRLAAEELVGIVHAYLT